MRVTWHICIRIGVLSLNYLKQVGDHLSVCMLNLLSEVSTLPTLEAIKFVKKKILILQIATLPLVGHVIKQSCGFQGGNLSR